MDLPNELRIAIERELRGDAAELARAVAALSARYREHGRADGPLDRGAVTAYTATRMSATYAATAAALAALAALLPAFAPASLLDVGAGTGAALWAAAETWPSLEAATLIERDQAMLTMGRRLADSAHSAALRAATWRSADLAGRWEAPHHDLVTAAYVLGELAGGAREALVAQLWARADGALVLVEPGTPRGWAVIRAAREQLRAAGASIVAPCPHQAACPLPADDWCHFAQRISRTRAQRAAKGGSLGYEDEKYSYVAVARQAGEAIAARVLRQPVTRAGRIELALCADSGLRHALVTRGDGANWRLAHDLRWGDLLLPGALEEA